MRQFHVSYHWSLPGKHGFGSMTIDYPHKVTRNSVSDFKNTIKKHNPEFEKVIILNWIQFEETDFSEEG
jgi:hypothetical protein